MSKTDGHWKRTRRRMTEIPKTATQKRETKTMKKAKAIGSAKARKQVKQITKRMLAYGYSKGSTPPEVALILGVDVDDVRNMLQGNKFSVPMLFKMVVDGRFDPTSILEGPELKRLYRARKTRGVTQKNLDALIHKLAWDYPGKELAKLTGLSVTGAYGLRYSGAHVTLYTVLGFIHSGVSIDKLVFGK